MDALDNLQQALDNNISKVQSSSPSTGMSYQTHEGQAARPLRDFAAPINAPGGDTNYTIEEDDVYYKPGAPQFANGGGFKQPGGYARGTSNDYDDRNEEDYDDDQSASWSSLSRSNRRRRSKSRDRDDDRGGGRHRSRERGRSGDRHRGNKNPNDRRSAERGRSPGRNGPPRFDDYAATNPAPMMQPPTVSNQHARKTYDYGQQQQQHPAPYSQERDYLPPRDRGRRDERDDRRHDRKRRRDRSRDYDDEYNDEESSSYSDRSGDSRRSGDDDGSWSTADSHSSRDSRSGSSYGSQQSGDSYNSRSSGRSDDRGGGGWRERRNRDDDRRRGGRKHHRGDDRQQPPQMSYADDRLSNHNASPQVPTGGGSGDMPYNEMDMAMAMQQQQLALQQQQQHEQQLAAEASAATSTKKKDKSFFKENKVLIIAGVAVLIAALVAGVSFVFIRRAKRLKLAEEEKEKQIEHDEAKRRESSNASFYDSSLANYRNAGGGGGVGGVNGGNNNIGSVEILGFGIKIGIRTNFDTATVAQFKHLVANVVNIQPDHFELYFTGRALTEPNLLLKEYGIGPNDKVTLQKLNPHQHQQQQQQNWSPQHQYGGNNEHAYATGANTYNLPGFDQQHQQQQQYPSTNGGYGDTYGMSTADMGGYIPPSTQPPGGMFNHQQQYEKNNYVGETSYLAGGGGGGDYNYHTSPPDNGHVNIAANQNTAMNANHTNHQQSQQTAHSTPTQPPSRKAATAAPPPLAQI